MKDKYLNIKLKFPKIPEKALFYWRDSCGFVALVDKGEYIKLYMWDGISCSWNEMFTFEKADL